jgi:ATP-dependent helicase HrpB
LTALDGRPRALLIAPPGAGKTTLVAPALLDQSWCGGEILLLVPRRLAARAAAEYMARQRGEEPGATIGYATRLDSRVGKQTRIVAMTHGVFLSRIQADPELMGVSAVLFDEVHERSVDNDLALALALDAAEALRPDLRIVAMSATLDGERFGRLLGNPPKIVSEGRSFPLKVQHIGRDSTARIEPAWSSSFSRSWLPSCFDSCASSPVTRSSELLRRRNRSCGTPPTAPKIASYAVTGEKIGLSG